MHVEWMASKAVTESKVPAPPANSVASLASKGALTIPSRSASARPAYFWMNPNAFKLLPHTLQCPLFMASRRLLSSYVASTSVSMEQRRS